MPCEYTIHEIVDWMIQKATEMTYSGNWLIDHDEISEEFGIPVRRIRKRHAEIRKEIERREQLCDVLDECDENGRPVGFDMNFYLDYCPYA